MSQFGMQMPGGQGSVRPQMNVYTALMFLAFVCLLAATLYIGLVAGPAFGKDGSPIGLQDSSTPQGITFKPGT